MSYWHVVTTLSYNLFCLTLILLCQLFFKLLFACYIFFLSFYFQSNLAIFQPYFFILSVPFSPSSSCETPLCMFVCSLLSHRSLKFCPFFFIISLLIPKAGYYKLIYLQGHPFFVSSNLLLSL